MTENELIHYGVKGMKWGVRRYQTNSGRLTSAGKKRYSEDGHEMSIRKHTDGTVDHKKRAINGLRVAGVAASTAFGTLLLGQAIASRYALRGQGAASMAVASIGNTIVTAGKITTLASLGYAAVQGILAKENRDRRE